jgi:hypothetical protein
VVNVNREELKERNQEKEHADINYKTNHVKYMIPFIYYV